LISLGDDTAGVPLTLVVTSFTSGVLTVAGAGDDVGVDWPPEENLELMLEIHDPRRFDSDGRCFASLEVGDGVAGGELTASSF
jgi:hypothetical protein